MSFRFVRPLLCAALLLSVGSAPAMAAPCAPTRMKFKVFPATVSSSSPAFVVIPGAAITFTQGGTGPSCVVVRFSAASSVVGIGISQVRAMLDNVTLAEPSSIGFSGENNSSVAHAVDFVFPSVAPGSHTLRILISVPTSGDTVFLDARTIIVQHAP